jgi:hypothetical protein
MANWAYVENNKVNGVYDLLPKSWKHISGLNLASDDTEFLKSLGWYPVNQQHELENFNPVTHQLDGYNYEVQGDFVVETPNIVEKDPEPQIDFAVAKHEFMKNLRKERTERLKSSDWTQLIDSQSLFDEETKIKWATYRQTLRNLPTIYESDETIDLSNVTWPSRV